MTDCELGLREREPAGERESESLFSKRLKIRIELAVSAALADVLHFPSSEIENEFRSCRLEERLALISNHHAEGDLSDVEAVEMALKYGGL